MVVQARRYDLACFSPVISNSISEVSSLSTMSDSSTASECDEEQCMYKSNYLLTKLLVIISTNSSSLDK